MLTNTAYNLYQGGPLINLMSLTHVSSDLVALIIQLHKENVEALIKSCLGRVVTVLENAVKRENEAERRKDEVHKRKVKADDEMHTAQSEQRKIEGEMEVSIIYSKHVYYYCAPL